MVRRTYMENFERHRQDLHNACRSLDIEHHSFITDKPLIDSVTQFLHRRA